jgi:acetyl/propionyl-CoA carboxylase alpha subunit
MVTGVDLVQWQLEVAQGQPLPLSQSEISAEGAAVECRIYAEDSEAGFLPSTGRLVDWHLADGAEGVRMDTGVETGQEVSVHYDPMLAKLITHGATREEANRKMLRALKGLSVRGVKTNRHFLMSVLSHPVYGEGRLSTHFIDEHMSESLSEVPDPSAERRALVAATLASFASRARARTRLLEIEPGYRNNDFAPQATRWRCGDRSVGVTHRNKGAGRLEIGLGEETLEARLVSLDDRTLVMELDGVRRRLRVVIDRADVYVQGIDTSVALMLEPRFPEHGLETIEGGCTAPMPGQVLRVCVEAGQEVDEGTPLVILEAMKMEHIVTAAEKGTIAEILVEAGQQVEVDAILVVME